MKCKNKSVKVIGLRGVDDGKTLKVNRQVLECIITNDDIGRTLSVNDGKTQFTFPFEPIVKYLDLR